MNRAPLTSSNVASAGWDSSTGILEVEFHDRRIYQYEQVPEAVYLGLLNADSPGSFLHNHVRGAYPYRQIS